MPEYLIQDESLTYTAKACKKGHFVSIDSVTLIDFKDGISINGKEYDYDEIYSIFLALKIMNREQKYMLFPKEHKISKVVKSL